MGIKDFSKTFSPSQILTMKQLPKGQKIAIDAMGEIYRAALGGSSVNMLTDKNGRPTMHIKVILAILMQFHANENDVIFCFDNLDRAALNIKSEEIKKRKEKKEIAMKKLSKSDAISDSEEDEESDGERNKESDGERNKESDGESKLEEKKPKKDRAHKRNMLEKQAFSLKQEQVTDILKLLDLLNFKYVIAPPGYEGEYMAVYLEKKGIVDAVFSGDTDMAAFGANTFYRRHPKNKKIYQYRRGDILKQISHEEYKATTDDIRRICVLLGCDFVGRKRGMGPKTVLKKFREVEFDEKQTQAYEFFSKELIEPVPIVNSEKIQFRNYDKRRLLEWLVEERSFNRDRLEKQLDKRT